MSLSDLQWQFFQHTASLIQVIKELGMKATGGELWRPPEMQQIYYKQGKSKVRTGRHQSRLAIDMNFFQQDEQTHKWKLIQFEHQKPILDPIGMYWESLDPKCRWGGNYRTLYDPYHFEMLRKPWRSEKQFYADQFDARAELITLGVRPEFIS